MNVGTNFESSLFYKRFIASNRTLKYLYKLCSSTRFDLNIFVDAVEPYFITSRQSYSNRFRLFNMIGNKSMIFCLLIALSSAYDGGCSDKCWDCLGPTDADCTYCVDHASRNYDEVPRCVCDPNWYGEGCKFYKDQPYATPSGDCDPKCMGGCTGPTSSDCVRCVEGAHLDQFGACVCNLYYGGIACDFPVDHNCDHRCYGGCSGHSNYDCVACVNNASRTLYGACVCDAFHTGEACEIDIIYDECHSLCSEAGCVGPEASDCNECVDNAHKNYHGCCECDNFWMGADCSDYCGTCDSKCFNSCTGPTAADCDCCVANASIDDNGACACDEGYAGEDCSLWIGECDPICYGCHGPANTNCDYCVENATKDEYGNCHCDWQWQGAGCDQFVYQGDCNPICDKGRGCSGPGTGDCDLCNEHAFLDNYDNCQCLAYWHGVDCGSYTYTGHCHALCDGECFGPCATDCVQCVPHAHRDGDQTCVCDENWTGDDCSVRMYVEACHPICDHRYGCVGPAREDCKECNDYAERDFYGHCQCKHGFGGDECRPCHVVCDEEAGCSGPARADCNACNANSEPDYDGVCQCKKGQHGKDCGVAGWR